jgi:hypothetical protein
MLKIGEAKSVIREVPLMEIGVPNNVGNIYTKESADKIFKILEEKKFFMGELVDVLLNDGGYDTWNSKYHYLVKLEEASHIIDDLFIEDNFIMAVVKFRNTRNGKEALKIFSDGLASFRPTIKGNVDRETSEILIHDVITVDLIPIHDKQLQKRINWINVKQTKENSNTKDTKTNNADARNQK